MVLVVVAGLLIVFERTGGRRVTFEVSTASGTALGVVYTDESELQTGMYRADRPYETVKTPWSTTVTFHQSAGDLRMAVDVADKSDVATCRIKAGGRVIAESTMVGGAMCISTLERAFPR